MSNHFPDIPTLNLVDLLYVAYWSNTASLRDPAYFNVDGVAPMSAVGNSTILPNADVNDPLLSVNFNFTTPGDAGSFDQDTEEGNVATVVDSVAQAVATATGNDLATVQGWITVQRIWTWQDSTSGFTLIYNNDTMTYPST